MGLKSYEKIQSKSDNKVTVSGKMLLGTIATMDFLGKVGRNVLKNNGIKKIDPKKYYPYELRSAIHKAALDQFGEIALVVSGFTAGEIYQDVEEAVANIYENNRVHLQSSNWKQNKKAIEKVFQALRDQSRRFTQNSVKDESGLLDYGYNYKFIGGRKFLFTAAMPQEIYQEPYYRGLNDYYFSKYFGKYFNAEVKFNKRISRSTYGWTEVAWEIDFKKGLSDHSEQKLVDLRKNHLKEQLMQSLMKKLEKQNNRLELISHKLGKYLPPQIHDSLFSGNFDDQIATRRKKLTIFFSDIKNFTSTSEGLQPEDLTKYLNEYFSEMTTIAINCGATIDKYIGDAMMVFFGDPDSLGEREDARSCVQMALRMQEKMKDLQEKWNDQGFADPFKVRMGINTGYCNVGNFGSAQRLTYTIIGGEVNVAQRLEAGADANGILMSYETYAHAQDMIEVEEREVIKMKGVSREIKVFSVVERKNEEKKKKSQGKRKTTIKEASEVQNIKKDMALMKADIKDVKDNIESILKKM